MYVRILLFAVALLPLGACSGTGTLFGEGDTPAKTYKAPDFVVNSRKPDMDFLPVGVSAPARADRPKTETEAKDLETELTKAGAWNKVRGSAAEGAGKSVGKAPPQ